MFLEINGVRVTTIPNDDVHRFVMDVTTGNHEIGELGSALRPLLR